MAWAAVTDRNNHAGTPASRERALREERAASLVFPAWPRWTRRGSSSRHASRDDEAAVIGRFAGLLGIVLAGVAVWIAGNTSDETVVAFQRFDQLAFEEARTAKKPIILYVASNADAACQEQNKGALRDERLIAALKPFARFKLDVPRQGPMAHQLPRGAPAGTIIPMFFFVSASGVQMTPMLGKQSAEALLEAAARAEEG